jgi:hypothetical protein
MPTGSFSIVMSVGGVTLMNTPVQETGDHPQTWEITLPAGEAGTLSTRTADGEGVLTSTGHSIEAADVVDIYWSGGARYAVTVDSVDANTITFDDTPAATGDVLPVATTAIVVTQRFQVNAAIDGDNVQMFGIICDQRSQCTFYDTGDAIIKQYALAVANAAETYYQSSSESNPLTGNPITYAMVSNGTVTAATLKIVSLEDSTV